MGGGGIFSATDRNLLPQNSLIRSKSILFRTFGRDSVLGLIVMIFSTALFFWLGAQSNFYQIEKGVSLALPSDRLHTAFRSARLIGAIIFSESA